MYTVTSSFVPRPHSPSPPSRRGTVGGRWSTLALALLLAACAHSPHAAVQDPLTSGSASMESAQESVIAVAKCRDTPSTRKAVQSIAQELQAQGLAFKAACSSAAKGWVVQVRVVDGIRATQAVRGPLADGHAVDMGTPAGVGLPGAPLDAQGFSPDVQHNRQWLRTVMARHQFDNLPDAWWHFAQRGAVPAQAADLQMDLAAR